MSTLPGLEGLTVARWVWGTLTGDPELQGLLGGAQAAQSRVVEGVYEGTAPTWLSFTILPPLDVKGVGLVHIASAVEFQLKAVGAAGSYDPLIPLYDRAHALLEGRTSQEPAQGGLVLSASRVSGIQYPERANGIEYRHLGGRYATLTQ